MKKNNNETVNNTNNEISKNVSTQIEDINENEYKLAIYNDDMLKLITHAKATGADPFTRINDVVHLFNLAIKHVELPEFSFEEKMLIANCLCGTVIDDLFITHLEIEVTDLIADDHQNFEDEDRGFTESRKNLIEKIHNLNYLQRIKLVHMIQSEIF